MNTLRDKLLNAARNEFTTHGYKKASIAAIARAADVSVGSVYTSFPSKKELFLDVYFMEAHTVQQQIIEQINWDDPRQALVEFLTQTTEYNRQNHILAAWHDPDIGPAVQAACRDHSRAAQLHSFLISQLAVWRSHGKAPTTLTDELLIEVLRAADYIDRLTEINRPIKQFIVESAVNSMFSKKGAIGGSWFDRLSPKTKRPAATPGARPTNGPLPSA